MTPKYPHPPGKTCLAYSRCGKYLFTSGSNDLVRRFTVGVVEEPDSIDVPALPLALAASDRHFAVGCEDGIAYLFNLTGNAPDSLLARSALPIRSLEFSPSGDQIAVIGDDTALIVSLDNESPIKLPVQGRAVAAKFHPTLPRVAVTCLDGSVVIVDFASEPEIVHTLQLVTPTIADFSDNRCAFAAFSPEGSLLALPTPSFMVAVYNSAWLQDFRLDQNHTNYMTDLQWCPNGRYIATTGRDGQVHVWDVVGRQSVLASPIPDVTQVRWHPNENTISLTTSKGLLYTMDAVPENLPTPLGQPILAARKQRALERELEDLTAEPRSDDSAVEDDEDDNDLVIEQPRKRVRAGKFNPGTPWLNNKRYLCLNSVGYVWTVHQDSEHNTVTISFHDESINRDIHFNDVDQFDMASLGTEGCLFANSEKGLVMMRFHQSTTDNWQFYLEDGDEVAAIALSDTVAVVATVRGMVITFSIYGMVLDVKRQRGIFALAGYGNYILALRSADAGLVYSLDEFDDATHGAIPVASGGLDVTAAELQTVFFTEFGDPCIYDQSGCLLALAGWRENAGRWVPLFSTPAASSETYWPLGIVDNSLMCICLKGQQRYPPIPLPVATNVPLAVPGLGKLESDYLCLRVLAQSEDAATELDKLLLRQFQAAAAENRVNKCMCLVRRLSHPRSGEAAVQIALHMDLTRLAEKVQDYLVSI